MNDESLLFCQLPEQCPEKHAYIVQEKICNNLLPNMSSRVNS